MKIRFAIQARIIRGVSFQKIIVVHVEYALLRSPSCVMGQCGLCFTGWTGHLPCACKTLSHLHVRQAASLLMRSLVQLASFFLSPAIIESEGPHRLLHQILVLIQNSWIHPSSSSLEYPSLGFVFRKISQSSLSVESLALAEDSPSLPVD